MFVLLLFLSLGLFACAREIRCSQTQAAHKTHTRQAADHSLTCVLVRDAKYEPKGCKSIRTRLLYYAICASVSGFISGMQLLVHTYNIWRRGAHHARLGSRTVISRLSGEDKLSFDALHTQWIPVANIHTSAQQAYVYAHTRERDMRLQIRWNWL